jgi:hypothetical protein
VRRALVIGLILLAAAQSVALLAAPRRETAALPPGEFAGTLMLGGFRGLACDLLWLRAVSAKEAGRFYESVALAEAITRVQPRFSDVWQHLAHDLAYNIAHEADGQDGKYTWFVAGVRANARGVDRNPGVEKLVRHLAWLFHHKGDLFHERIEAEDWSGLINPLLAEVRARTGDQLILDLPAGPGSTNFAIANRLYTASVALGDQQEAAGKGRLAAFVRRMVCHTLDADANLARNRGNHLAAIRRWLDAGEAWQRVSAWVDSPLSDANAVHSRNSTREVVQRVEGRLRRKTADLARLLAPDPATGNATAAAIEARLFDEARILLAKPGWLSSSTAVGRIRWLDE